MDILFYSMELSFVPIGAVYAMLGDVISLMTVVMLVMKRTA